MTPAQKAANYTPEAAAYETALHGKAYDELVTTLRYIEANADALSSFEIATIARVALARIGVPR